MSIWAAFLIHMLLQIPLGGITGGSSGGGGITGTFQNAGACVTGGAGCSYSHSTTAGDIIVCAPITNTPSATVSCNATGYTFTACGGPITSGNNTLEAFWAIAPTTTSVTWNGAASSSTDYFATSFIDITPSGTPTLDKNATGSFSSTTSAVTGTTSTISTTPEIVVAAFGITNNVGSYTWTAGSGYSNMTSQSSGVTAHADAAIEWKNQSTSATVQGTATLSAAQSGVGIVCTFQ